MKLNVFLLLFCLITLTSISQETPYQDSLRNVINSPAVDTSKKLIAYRDLMYCTLFKNAKKSRTDLDNYLKMSVDFGDSTRAAHSYQCFFHYYLKTDSLDKAKESFIQERQYALGCTSPYFRLNSYIDEGVYYEELGQTEKAQHIYSNLIDSAIIYNQPVMLARAKINLGNLYVLEGEYFLAIDELESAVLICKEKNYVGFMASTLFVIGDINLAIENYELSQSYYEEAIDWSIKRGNNNTKIKALHRLAYMHMSLKNHTICDSIIERTLDSSLTCYSSDQLAESLFILGKSKLEQHDTISSLFHLNQGLKLLTKKESSVVTKGKILGLQGTIYAKQMKLNLAKLDCRQSYAINKNTDNLNGLIESCNCLYAVFKKERQSDSALYYHEKYAFYIEKKKNIEQIKEIVKFQKDIEYSKIHFQDSLKNIQQTNELSLNHQKQITHQKSILYFALVPAFIIVVFSAFIFRAYRKNRKQKKDLEKLDILNKQIFSIIAHDFTGPLLSLNCLVDALEKPDLKREQLALYTNDIKNHIKQTSNILENLLNWAKVELSFKVDENLHTSPSEILEEIKMTFEESINKKKLTIINNLPNDISVRIHPDLLRIIIRNLISNAIKYSFDNGSININHNSKTQQLLVEDDGIGMNSEQQKMLFSKVQYSRLGTDQEMGFGVGLYITHELIKKIGWNLEVRSEERKGSSFILNYKL